MMRVKRIFSGKNAVNQTDSALSSEKKDCSSNLGSPNPDTVVPTLIRDEFFNRLYRRKVMDSYFLIQTSKLCLQRDGLQYSLSSSFH